MSSERAERYPFPSCMRLSGNREFQAVYAERTFQNAGMFRIYGRPNDLSYGRLGLSVSRRVGNAVTRHRAKRMLREAFRLLQHELPAGFDWVVSVWPHPSAALEDYQRQLQYGADQVARRWKKRRERNRGSDPAGGNRI